MLCQLHSALISRGLPATYRQLGKTRCNCPKVLRRPGNRPFKCCAASCRRRRHHHRRPGSAGIGRAKQSDDLIIVISLVYSTAHTYSRTGDCDVPVARLDTEMAIQAVHLPVALRSTGTTKTQRHSVNLTCFSFQRDEWPSFSSSSNYSSPNRLE